MPTAKPIKLGKAAKALLDAELALSASWPTDDAPRLPPSLAKSEKRLERLRVNRAWAASVTDWRSLARESIAHPVTAFRVFRDIRSSRAETSAPDDDTPLD
ncbi:MAG: hypothetical protein WAK00_15155, partial [Microbacterium sp.]|uniref:hypothetical protein n=1 Tax=Microbacterium sp. TaxID=51671 RepID=UPI003BB1DF99